MSDQIKDGLYAQVSGTVRRVFETANGPGFSVEFQRKNSEYPDQVAVFGGTFSVSEGERVTVKGWLSWSTRVKEGKTFFNVAMNMPQLVASEPVETAPGEWN
jgi:hypothetical protein